MGTDVVRRDAESLLRRLLAANNVTQASQAATDHTVQTLGCDVSWVGTLDGERLVMSAYQGLHTAEMASAWYLRLGDGIGGRAAQEGRTRSSSDYQHDSRRTKFKRLIDNEGIQAVLVVPLLLGDRTLGVLYAGRRTPYSWTEAEQSALEEIGEDLSVRLNELDIGGAREVAVAESRRRVETLEEGLRGLADLAREYLGGTEISPAVEALAALLGARVELRHADGALIHAAGRVGLGPTATLYSGELDGTDGLSVVIGIGEGQSSQPPAGVSLGVCVLHLHLLRLRERERTAEQLRGELLDQLFTGRVSDPASVRRRLSLIGFSWASSGAQVVVVGVRGGGGVPARFRASLRTTFPDLLVDERDDRLVALIQGGDAVELRRKLESLARRESQQGAIVAGIGRPCRELIDFSMSYDEARAACGLSMGDDAVPDVVTARSLGIQGMASLPIAQLSTTVQEAFGPLISLDETRGTELVATLRAYLAHDRHLPDTAAQLRVHYNTVRNRIARIEELLGVDMRDVDDRFRLETAVRMQSVMKALS